MRERRSTVTVDELIFFLTRLGVDSLAAPQVAESLLEHYFIQRRVQAQ